MHSAPAAVLAPTMASHLHHTRNFPHHHGSGCKPVKNASFCCFWVFEIDLNGFNVGLICCGTIFPGQDYAPLTNCHSVTYGLQFTIVSVVVLSVKWTTALKHGRFGPEWRLLSHCIEHKYIARSFPLTLRSASEFLWTSFLVILHIYL